MEYEQAGDEELLNIIHKKYGINIEKHVVWYYVY